MKITDIIAKFLAGQGIQRVYTVSGGGDLHLIDSICKRDDIRIICPQNEQGASFAADAEARLVGIGCALATSGPGATNFITGIATSYYDSIPVLYLTGNQTRERLGNGLGVRQFGFQSMPFVELVQTITKYAVIVMDEKDVLFELEKALWFAQEGRPGPVVVDIPDDIQRADVYPESLRHFTPNEDRDLLDQAHIGDVAQGVLQDIAQARRPVFIFGAGLRKSDDAKRILDALQVPCVTTWGAADLFCDHHLWFGTFGTHGIRGANFTVQNADLIVSVGSRLDTKATGSPASSFAPKARLIMVDIDAAELSKMAKIGRPLYRSIVSDAAKFLERLRSCSLEYAGLKRSSDDQVCENPWIARVQSWKRDYPAVLPEYGPENPYRFMQDLGSYLTKDDVVVSDTGCPLAWAMQVLPFKGRFIHAFNQTPMGYGLPASIGAAGAHKGRVILLTGDGGLSENITEFATIYKHQLDIRTILFNNRGHAMCRQTQKQWLGSVYHGTSAKDLATPNFHAVALAYGITCVRTLEQLMTVKAPAFLEVMVDEEQGVVPQVRYGKSIEDAAPALPEGVLEKIMAVV